MTSTADETAGLLTDASPPSDPDNYSFYRLFPVGEVEESVGKAATVDGTHLAVFRYEGGYHAVDNRCPHMGYPMSEGSIRDGYLDVGDVAEPLRMGRLIATAADEADTYRLH